MFMYTYVKQTMCLAYQLFSRLQTGDLEDPTWGLTLGLREG